eukprot:CAMPEP_0173431360 /NCGR_PEP_ID=MMETSP1357-20121228/9525_1 /TAXON_ID=77926 /ORGANISM="Hemiselmis rufescens, Strain PCC563" /LENGTH=147 /DNA_ID=CAMNT_0014395829 /DNA_START=102 /DNA_END=545 /DNA_ORIENTATION=+
MSSMLCSLSLGFFFMLRPASVWASARWSVSLNSSKSRLFASAASLLPENAPFRTPSLNIILTPTPPMEEDSSSTGLLSSSLMDWAVLRASSVCLRIDTAAENLFRISWEAEGAERSCFFLPLGLFPSPAISRTLCCGRNEARDGGGS